MSRQKRLEIDKEWLQSQIDMGKYGNEIAETLGCSATAIYKAMRRFGLMSTRWQKCILDEHEIRKLYLNENLPVEEITTKLGIGFGTFYKSLEQYGIERRPALIPNLKRGHRILDKAKLIRMYIEEERPVEEIVKTLGGGFAMFYRSLEYHNIPRRSPLKLLPKPPSVVDEQELRLVYSVEQMPIEEIVKNKGWCLNIIYRSLRYYKIERRPSIAPDKPWTRKEWLEEQYRIQGKEIEDIAQEVGVSPNTIRFHLWRFALTDVSRYKIKASNRLKELWEDKEFVEKLRVSGKYKFGSGYRTDIESITEAALQRTSLKYIFEYRIGRYSIDFYLVDYNIAIECDGEWWHDKKRQSDEKRDAHLRNQGIITIRLKGRDIKADIDSLLSEKLLPHLTEKLD